MSLVRTTLAPFPKSAIATVLAGGFLTTPAVMAAGTPVGPPIVAGDAFGAYYVSQSVARAADGRLVAGWIGPGGTTVVARRFAADGTPLGDATTVVEIPADDVQFLRNPHVAIDDNGDTVISWDQHRRGPQFDLLPIPFLGPLISFGLESATVHARTFGADGAALSGDVLVANYPAKSDFRTDLTSNVAMDADGDFAVTWINAHSTAQINYYIPAIYAVQQTLLQRRFNRAGRPVSIPGIVASAVFRRRGVNVEPTGTVIGAPSIASDSAGNFAVAWAEREPSGTLVGAGAIKARTYGPFGFAAGPATLVNTRPVDFAFATGVAMTPSGRYTITWDGCPVTLCARNFLPGGAPGGDEFDVSDLTGGGDFPSVAVDATGDPVIAFLDNTSYPGVYVRSFKANGNARASSRRVSASNTNFSTAIGADAQGNFAVAFTRFESPSTSLLIQLYSDQ